MSTTTGKSLKFIPDIDDIFGAAVCAGFSMLMKENAGAAAVEQLASQLAADNIANYVDMTNNMTSDKLPLPVTEADTLTGVVRAGWSLYKGRSNQQVLIHGLRGVASRLIGRELRKSVLGSSM